MAKRYIKREVSRREAERAKIVYPNHLSPNNTLLHSINKQNNGTFNLVMKNLENFPKGPTPQVTQRAIKMLQQQLKRLHNNKQTHSNLGAQASKLVGPGKDKFATLKRQLLVERDSNGTIKSMYLTNFNVRNTNDTVSNETHYVQRFVNSLSVKNFKLPVFKGSMNNFRTPPGSPRTPR